MHERIVEIATDENDPRPELLELAPRLLEWQRWFLIHALELLPGVRQVFRFRTVLLLVARQNGKTTLIVYLILWRLFQDSCRLVVGSAQTLEIAQEAWDTVVAIGEGIPELADEIKRVQRVNGKQALILESRERYKIASSKGGGRGLTGDLVVLDELREHKTWSAWAAMSKTTMARERAQVLGVSNAGDLDSIVLRSLRDAAIASIEGRTPEVPDDVAELMDAAAVGLFEWSAGPDALGQPRSVLDREGWAQANPSLGWTVQEAAILASALGGEPEWVFRAEVLCEFVNRAASGPFPNGAWDRTRVTAVTRDASRPACYGIDLSHARTMAYIAVAFWDTEGRKRVEIAAARAGTEWIIPWLSNPLRKIRPDLVALQTRGAPISSMVSDFEQAGIDLAEWAGPDLARWTGVFYDGVRGHTEDDEPVDGQPLTLTHGPQPVLDIAATTARIKPLGDGWVIDRKNSPEDAAPLVAAIAAIGLLNTHPTVPGPSVYEQRGLITF